ncbi:MAG: 2-amino-4-hydroxy-6-hydroxymethyldihydropteridine diphosphokinase [Silvanigrellales bacterium]|jgi:2-amino-4-hydroxy-6-hydroxymethyldihydropteridine diphosphokinase|nr:2-amino-4-hydroxy-6-hydroxymethyldihydropteridine diphosphokinase [Silvanigrellales bacterium]
MSGFRFLLAFGSNLGDRHRNLDEAVQRLSDFVVFVAHSRRLETEPLPSDTHDVSDHGPFLNMVSDVFTLLAPQALYERIREVEDALGHSREVRWRPRVIDVDILLCALEAPQRRLHTDRACGAPHSLQGDGGMSPDTRQAFAECVPFLVLQGENDPDSLGIPHAGLSARPFLHVLLVDDLKLPQACLGASGFKSRGGSR